MQEGAITINTSAVIIAGPVKKQSDGTLLTRAEVNATTLTVRDRISKSIVHSLNDTVYAVASVWGVSDGMIKIPLVPLDNVMIDSNNAQEIHRFIIKFTYNTTDKGVIVGEYIVENPDLI